MNKSMTSKLGHIFIFMSILTYFILLGLLGEEGYLHSRAMRRELETLRQRQEVLNLQVEALEKQKELMSSQDALKDAAFRFGYQGEGEQVFYFTNGDSQEQARHAKPSLSDTDGRTFEGLSKPWVALIALAFSLLFTLVWHKGAKRRASNR